MDNNNEGKNLNESGAQVAETNVPSNADSQDVMNSQKDASASDFGAQPPASPFVTNQQNDVPKESEIPAQAPPRDALTSSPIVGPHSADNGRGFKTFVILGIILVLMIWGGVAYLYFQNKSAKEGGNETAAEEMIVKTTPTPQFMPEQIKIQNGSIVNEKPGGEKVVLVDKANYPSTGITGFLKVAVSPDNKNICFESWSPAPEPALYVSDIEGQNVKKVSDNRQSCIWARESNAVYYINTSTKTAPVNIFKYDLSTETETDMTSETVPSGVVRRFEIVGLSADESKIICKYENIGGAASSETMSECEIDLQTGEVKAI